MDRDKRYYPGDIYVSDGVMRMKLEDYGTRLLRAAANGEDITKVKRHVEYKIFDDSEFLSSISTRIATHIDDDIRRILLSDGE